MLPDWKPRAVAPGTTWGHNLTTPALLARARLPDGTSPLSPTGTTADAWHIAWAKEKGIPLVTNEGFTPTGYAPGKIAPLAAAEGVVVLFPKDFYARKLDQAAAIQRFCARFEEQAEGYLATHPSHRAALQLMYGSARHVLLGETQGRDTPVNVSIAVKVER